MNLPLRRGAGSSEERATTSRARRARTRRRTRTDFKTFARENLQLIAAGVLLTLGIVLVMLGWWGAAHTNIFTEQIPYLISGGLLGLGLIIAAGFLAYASVAQRNAEQLRRDIALMLQRVPSGELRTAPSEFAAEPVSANGHVYVVPGGRSYHHPGCPIVEGKKDVRQLQPAQAVESGYSACKLCGPD